MLIRYTAGAGPIKPKLIRKLINSRTLICPSSSTPTTSCEVYFFQDSKPDSLELGAPFTGNVKVILAATSTAGINPAILAGIKGTFKVSEDPVNMPVWVQFECSAVAMTYIVGPSFNGVIKFALNNNWITIDAGYNPDPVRSYYRNDGIDDSITIDRISLAVGTTITFKVILKTTTSPEMRTLIGSLGAGWSTSKIGYRNGLWSLLRFPSFELDGVKTVDGTPIPLDGKVHTVSVKIADVYTLRTLQGIGAYNPQSGGTGDHCDAVIFDFKITTKEGVLVFHMPIDDGWKDNGSIRELVSNQAGTLYNGQQGSWYTDAIL